jgi:hypothetical protein
VSGRINDDSDLDFLIVVPPSAHAEAAIDLLYNSVRRKPMPCDFLVVKQTVLEKYRDNPGMIYREILESGKEIYAI